jgi:hypothetical protein
MDDKARTSAASVAAAARRFATLDRDVRAIKWGLGALVVLALFIAGTVWLR